MKCRPLEKVITEAITSSHGTENGSATKRPTNDFARNYDVVSRKSFGVIS